MTDALERLHGHTDAILAMRCAFDGSLFASKSSDGTVRLWMTENRSTIAMISEPVPAADATGLAFHPALFRLATCSDDGRSVRIWELDADRLLYTL